MLLESVEGSTNIRYNYELNVSYCLDKNLNDYLIMCLARCRFEHALTNEQTLEINRFIKKLKVVQKKMRFFRYLYVTEINGYVDHEKMEGLETRIQFMADNKIFRGELKASKFTQSRTFKAKKLPKGFSHHLRSLLMYLRNKNLDNFPNNVSARNIDVAIEFLLVFLDDDVSNHAINGKMLNEVLQKVGTITGDILCVIQRLLPRSLNEDETSKVSLCSIQILEKIDRLKEQVETYYKSLKFNPSQFPTVGRLSFLDSLLRKLNDLLKSESGLVFMMKPHVAILEKELSSVSSIFRDVAKVHHEHKILKDLQRRTIDLAYEAEVAIGSILAQYNAFWHIFCSLPTIIKEIKNINEEVTEINPVIDEEMVGFGNDIEKLIQYLIRGTNDLDVIPIIAMGGQGKTTIARKVYNNDMIVSRFDVQACCIISQSYNLRELLQEIFSQVTSSKDNGDEEDILSDKLRKSLIGKRYLIVLDDMWDCMSWDDLRLCFPDVGHRSRIVVTTRLEKVGEHVKCYTDLYFLPFLTPDESCELLQKKVFQKEDYPPELQDVSLAVAEKCKGLPLEIILVAGIINRNKMEASWWHEVKDALFEYLDRESGEYSLSTMQLSYDNLPDYLKPCLLYMGMFPEDARIPVSKLISLWIAEGFVQNVESGRLMEEIAEDYLMDLISSNVVMISRRRYNGKIKCSQVHDVVLHFCLEKSREERFMVAVKGHDNQFQPSEWKVSRVRFSFSEELSKFASLSSKLKPFHQHLRSLITTNRGRFYIWNPFPQGLSVLPDTFWKMEKLRHVEITLAEFNLENNNQQIFKESLKLENLRILKKVEYIPTLKQIKLIHCKNKSLEASAVKIKEEVTDIEGCDRIDITHYQRYRLNQKSESGDTKRQKKTTLLPCFIRCPNLQELDISIGANENSADFCPKLEDLTQLQIFRLSFQWPQIVSELHLPSNLMKLVLEKTHIESAISIVGELLCLEYLQLSVRWDALEESFPQLETLVIKGCYMLEEVPLSFADIPTLRQIKLINCNNKSLEASAVKIKEEVADIEGCDHIDLTVGVTGKSKGAVSQAHACNNDMTTAAKAQAGWTDFFPSELL
ncbi:hypothetical protein P3S67_002533 [Capsicum chacoense]